MNLTFLHPYFLFGLAAGILPILIHRLTKRKGILRKFSAVRFILQSQRVVARPQRLKNFLLLALRVLAVLSLVFILSRPVLTRQGLLFLGHEGAKVLILDNSLSMGYREDNESRYDLAKMAAKEIIESLKDQVIILPTASLQDSRVGWMSPQEALRELDRIPLSFGRGHPGHALNLAYRRLNDFKTPGEIVIISDMALGDWEGVHVNQLGSVSSDVGITFLRMGGPHRDSNFSVKEVRLAEGEAAAGIPFRLEVTVSNLSDISGSILIPLYLSGVKVDQKSIDLKAREEGKGYFELFLDKSGWVDGEVRLSGDRLLFDDLFYFPLKVREKVKVLIVDGDPKRSLRTSESYYLVNSLHPGGSERSPFLTKVITERELIEIDPKRYDAFFLLNCARFQASKLSSILELDKPVFIFLGDRVIPEEYNRFPLFPWRIREVKEAGPLKPERIVQVDSRLGALKALSEAGGESLKSASFSRYVKIEGSMKPLLSFGNRDPFLVESDFGKGRLFLFSSSADLDWNDLPLKAAYLPLIQGLTKEAVGLNKGSVPGTIRFGEPFEEKGSPVQIKGPEGGPGLYRFTLPSGEVRRGVNLPSEESDLDKMGQEEIKKRLGIINMKMVEYKTKALSGVHAGKKELWPFLLSFVLIVLAFEMGVANIVPGKGRQQSSTTDQQRGD